MKKKTKRKKLDEKSLSLWSKIVRLKGMCEICGAIKTDTNKLVLQGHHVVSRRYSAGRWTLENSLCICQSCHFWEKVDPEKFRDMVLFSIGKNKFNELKKKYMHTCKVSEGELSLIHIALKLEYKKRLEKQSENT